MKTIIGLILIALVSFVSCNKTTKKYYYDSGELRSTEIINAKDSLSYITEYYKNGQVEYKGYVQPNGELTGYWEEYYSDGSLRWRGMMKNGVAQLPENIKYDSSLYALLEVKGDVKYAEIGKPFQFRIYVEGVHPMQYYVTFNFTDTVSTDYADNFPYSLTLTKEIFSLCEERGLLTEMNGYSHIHIVAHVPNKDHQIIMNTDQPILGFLVPIKKE